MKNRSDWDNYELPDEYDFSGKEAVRGRFYSPRKKSVTIRLDDDVVLYFRKLAGIRKVGYQSLINAALRERMNRQTKHVDESEMQEIRGRKPVNESIARALRDAEERRGGYV
ncbi:MAG: BrnA antitoxin family protein [Spirochaetaceae bacterium]|nr:BrnA antitoxin family protein [Spirochaetaceae bacterium]